MENLALIKESRSQRGLCLACGQVLPKRARKYCSISCKDQIVWVLGLSKGLLKAFNVRFAAFYFTDQDVILDLLPSWSEYISRFSITRTPGQKPAYDLKRLILSSGEEWYHLLKNRHSKSSASLRLITRNHRKDLDPKTLVPKVLTRPKLTKKEKQYLNILSISEEELFSDLVTQKIRSSFRKMAKVFHPDVGGDEELFKLLNEAHFHMLNWSMRPKYCLRKLPCEFWSYDSLTNKWSPPA